MNFQIEKEYKILVNKEQFYTLLQGYPSLEFHTQVNTYFDTLDGQIKQKKGAMRIRYVNHQYIFTLKMPAEDGLKEHECIVSDDSLSTIETNHEIQDLLKAYDIQGKLIPLCVLTTKRAVFETEYAELCFDISQYGNQEDYEIEYEWKKEHDGFQAFNEILSKIQLTYVSNCDSKIKRAMNGL